MLDKKDYMEPMCPFDRDFHKEIKASKPLKRINVGEMIAQVDRLHARNDKQAAIRVLEEYRAEAERFGDCDGELACVSELLGSYRITRNEERGIKTADRCFELLKISGIGGSISAGTILVNCATMLSSFSQPEKALKCYTDACRCYSNHLPATDTRFAALYNNMASVYEQVEDFENAVKYYKTAVAVLEENKERAECMLDMAVTFVNLAQLMTVMGEYEESAKYTEMAEKILDDETLERDYYYAHTAEKLAGGFGFLGYFLKEAELNARAKEIYERN